MTSKRIPSINEISLAINSLFLDITEPMSFSLNKSNLFKTYKKIHFRFGTDNGFEFNFNPILRFENRTLLKEFLNSEKQLCVGFQEFEAAAKIQNIIKENDNLNELDEFYLDYSIEIDGDEVEVFFYTNLLIFKYEVIG